MSTNQLLILLPLLALGSATLTAALRQYALRQNLVDIPNVRSSHTTPTPRGGGVAIAVCMLGALLILPDASLGSPNARWALLGAGLLVAVVGFIDDHGHLAARWRLVAHFCAATWALMWLNGSPPVALFGDVFDANWIAHLIAAVYLVWMLNLYNFMDGIDGIAGIEAITVCAGAALLYTLSGFTHGIWLPLSLGAAVIGFLAWNFPPARIFMGDSGSGFLGIALGIMSLQAGWSNPDLLWAWFILLGVFVVDASFTLLTRLLRGDKVHEAHRNHAYQHAARKFGTHRPVTLAVGLINISWLLPIALLVGIGSLNGLIGLVIAYTPLLLLVKRYGAGKP